MRLSIYKNPSSAIGWSRLSCYGRSADWGPDWIWRQRVVILGRARTRIKYSCLVANTKTRFKARSDRASNQDRITDIYTPLLDTTPVAATVASRFLMGQFASYSRHEKRLGCMSRRAINYAASYHT